MELFDLIYSWVSTYLFSSEDSTFNSITYSFGNSNVSLSLGQWLSYSVTIIILVLLFIVLCIFVKWLFKLFAGLLSH